MEAVRDLSWGSGFQPNRVEAHTGFEPVSPQVGSAWAASPETRRAICRRGGSAQTIKRGCWASSARPRKGPRG